MVTVLCVTRSTRLSATSQLAVEQSELLLQLPYPLKPAGRLGRAGEVLLELGLAFTKHC